MAVKIHVLTLFSVKLDRIRHFELTLTEVAHRIEKLERVKSNPFFLAHTVVCILSELATHSSQSLPLHFYTFDTIPHQKRKR